MEMHEAKVSLFGVLVLFTLQASRHQKVLAQQVGVVPVRVPLLQKKHVATQHGSWVHLRRLASTVTASTTPTPSQRLLSLPKAKLALSAQGPAPAPAPASPNSDIPCGAHVQPLCPVEEEPPGDGLIKKTLPPEEDSCALKIHVHRNWAEGPSYTFTDICPTETCHNIKLRIMKEDGQLASQNGKRDYNLENKGGQLIEVEEHHKREGEDPDDKYKKLTGLFKATMMYQGLECEDVHTMQYYNVPSGGRLDLIDPPPGEPDGSGLKAGQGPETEPPCVTRPPCQSGFSCHDVEPISKGRASNLYAPSNFLLIHVILILFTSIW